MTTTNTALAPMEQIQGLLKLRVNALKNFLGDDKNAMRFVSSVMQCIQNTPKLLQCDRNSLMGAFMECAAVGLYPSAAGGDCYVIPYGDKAQFQIGYKGIKTLAYRAGVKQLGMEIVYSKDFFEEELGTNPRIIHKPSQEANRGEPVRAYAWAKLSEGNVVFKSMSAEQIMKIKKMSKASSSQNSPWNSNDPMLIMWQKTAFKQLSKMIPTSPELDRAVHADNISERGGYYKNEGELIEVPFDEKVGDENTYSEVCEAIKSIKTESEYKRIIGGVGLKAAKLNAEQQQAVRQLAAEKQAEIKKTIKPAKGAKKELGAGEKVAEQMAGGEEVDAQTGEVVSAPKSTAETAEEIFADESNPK